jgi:exonuclease SbcC
MNTSELIPKLSRSFSTCTPVSGDMGIVRCERTYMDRARSVYFFQSAPELPTDDQLSRIHEDVVSPSYFQAQDASRWNHYVVFVANDSDKDSVAFRRRQRRIESDKNYARKIVVFQSELDRFVDHSLPGATPEAPSDSVVSVWTKTLLEAGLASVQREVPRAQLIRDIRTGKTKPQPSIDSVAGEVAVQVAPRPEDRFLKIFDVKKFGVRSMSGCYQFRRVNLLRGPNGSGKTSLLEAIEHFICGATSRSGGNSEGLDAIATFATGKPVPYKTHNNSNYQDKDLRWYGRTINRGNRLYEGFARFNFLNTDAAAHFAGEASLPDLKEALSMVALGPDAAHTWNRMGEFEDHIDRELTPINNSLTNLATRLKGANARLAALQTSSPQVEAQRTILNDALQKLGWPPRRPPAKEDDAEWFKELNILRDYIQLTNAMPQLASAAAVKSASELSASDLAMVSELDSRLIENMKQQNAISSRRSALVQRGTDLQRLVQYFRSPFVECTNAKKQLEQRAAEITQRLISSSSLNQIRELFGSDVLSHPFAVFYDALGTTVTTEREQMESNIRRRSLLQQKVQAGEALRAQIQRLGHQLAEAEPHASKCPLCRTQMSMPELLERLDQATDGLGQSKDLADLSVAIAQSRAKIDRLVAIQLTGTRLAMLSQNAGRMTTEQLMDFAARDQQALEAVQAHLNQIRSQLGALENSGFNEEEFAEIQNKLQPGSNEKTNVAPLEANSIDQLLKENEVALSALTDEAATLRQEFATIQADSAALNQQYGATPEEAGALRLKIHTEANILKRLSDCLQALPAAVRRSRSDDLKGLAEDAEQVVKAVDELNAQIQADRARSSEIKVLQSQIARDQSEQIRIKPEADRLDAALKALRALRKNHSLESGLATFLTSNLSAIQDIFSRIHLPHELRLSDLANWKLERIGAKQPVELHQISTGQRAALVLSVFFSLNLSLRQGPPQMLIDDPIAHIDDLNSLSFLDFLADVAESGKRQIFFATANEKLANLFQKKMEFLGEEFRAYQMPGVNQIWPASERAVESAGPGAGRA